MDPITLGLIIAVPVLLGYLLVRYQTSTHDTFKKMGIDTPPTSWYMGHFPESFKYGIFDVQTKFYNQYKDKKVYGWYDGRTPNMIVKDLDMIKDITVKNFNSFTDRRIIVEVLDPSFQDNLTNITGEHWKHVRNVVSPTFSSGRVKKMLPHIQRNTKLLLEYFRKKQERNEEVELRDICYSFTLNIIASTAFGIDINVMEDPKNQFAKEAQAIVNGSPAIAIIIFLFPGLAKILDMVGLSAFPKKSMKFFADIVDSAMTSRKEDGQAGKVNDFLDLVLNAKDESEHHSGKGGLTRSEIHGQALVFFFAGYDTVATVLSFTLFLLANHPECLKKAQEEIDEKIGKQTIGYDKVQELTYLDMCLNEAMRMFPPGVFIDRVCQEDVTIGGVHIPKGMIVTIPCYAIHLDSEIWPEPEKFDPERFTPENKASRHHYAHLPFGQGPRNCIGMRLALLELKIAIASILQQFDIVPCSKTVYPVKLSKIFLKANDGLWVKLEARK